MSNEELHALPERSRSGGPNHQVSVITEMFVTDENIGKMEEILDTWNNNLKVSAAIVRGLEIHSKVQIGMFICKIQR